ncbi:DNA cytosine methyltransferase [Cellulomonas sp. T2.31MG-18]|uniref:DNA cytosine methyltransferase n=1 Tax=Cellulomonas sp. T2.31MG-18 TaxID=3157619 RepID=UPI00366DFAAF
MSFTFADLFAGIGGFHAALSALGGDCTFVSEIDADAARVYGRNWDAPPNAGNIVPLTEGRMAVAEHDVLAAGFPCQPFSKSGFQRGMDETRGTLFWNICRVLEEIQPPVILLENVRNLAGPRHRETTWKTIIRSLRDLGYRVSSTPTVFSPHLLPRELGGRPQVRERVFITGTYVGRDRAWRESDDGVLVENRPVGNWSPLQWNVARDLPLDPDDSIADLDRYALSVPELEWVAVWEDFVQRILPRLEDGERLPGFPIWADDFRPVPHIPRGTPAWKADFLVKNSAFYVRHRHVIDAWLSDHDGLADLPASRRKLEWQAQDAKSLAQTVMHFRPSGIRAKRPTYLPALVAITQTSVIGERSRRITPREAARLQGLPDWFDFGDQVDAASYKQMGNGVNVGAAYYVFRQHVMRDKDDIAVIAPHIVDSVLASDPNPDIELEKIGAAREGALARAS